MRQLLGDCLCRPICFFDLPIVFRSFETPVMQIHATLQSVIGAFYRQTHLTTFGETMVLSFRGQQVAATTSRGTSQLANPSKPKQTQANQANLIQKTGHAYGPMRHVMACLCDTPTRHMELEAALKLRSFPPCHEGTFQGTFQGTLLTRGDTDERKVISTLKRVELFSRQCDMNSKEKGEEGQIYMKNSICKFSIA